MNYVHHLNALMEIIRKDPRLNPTHISLYLSLFRLWNIMRFPESFFINREEVMEVAKIGSKGTYHRCLRDLDSWRYICYMPSHNPYKGSKVKVFELSAARMQRIESLKTASEGTKQLEL